MFNHARNISSREPEKRARVASNAYARNKDGIPVTTETHDKKEKGLRCYECDGPLSYTKSFERKGNNGEKQIVIDH